MVVSFHLLSLCLKIAISFRNTLRASFCFYFENFMRINILSSGSDFYAENILLLVHHRGSTQTSL